MQEILFNMQILIQDIGKNTFMPLADQDRKGDKK